MKNPYSALLSLGEDVAKASQPGECVPGRAPLRLQSGRAHRTLGPREREGGPARDRPAWTSSQFGVGGYVASHPEHAHSRIRVRRFENEDGRPRVFKRRPVGGRDRRRSGDLTLFRRALYQLSYSTSSSPLRGRADLTGFEPATSALTGRRALRAAPQVLGVLEVRPRDAKCQSIGLVGPASSRAPAKPHS